jgi:hypothetical protein
MLKTVLGLCGLLSCAAAQSDSVKVKWLEGTPDYLGGVTFGVPWPRGQHLANATTFTASGGAELQSWVTAYWPDGSLKWTGHALGATDSPADEYTITASGPGNATFSRLRRQGSNSTSGVQVRDSGNEIIVDTGKVTATFPRSGDILVSSIKSGGKVVGNNGRLILRSQSGTPDDDEDGKPTGIDYFSFASKIHNTTVSDAGSQRALVTIHGIHTVDGEATHADWLPFTVRFYLYANSEAIRIIHTIIYDGEAKSDFVSGQ